MSLVIILSVIILFSTGSIAYVYSSRGITRYESFGEYIRKGWPIFTPLNCVLYLFTPKKASGSIMDVSNFKELNLLAENWQTIREEAMALQSGDYFNSLNKPGAVAHYDVGFRTFFKYGWRKFYLKWYGYNHASALKMCPKTVELINKVSCVNGAMFSILPPGGKLTRHQDPFACSLRYHLGLDTPNSENCFINVDGKPYSWHDGEAFMFDETYIHFVNNNTDDYRLILMCDIDRPTNILGSIFNWFYKLFLRGSIVPNTEEDKCGLANKVFRNVSPLLAKGKELKATNKRKYQLIKYTVNSVLLLVLLSLIAGVFLILKGILLAIL